MGNKEEIEYMSTKEACGKKLVELGDKYNNIFVVDADVSKSTKTCYFAEKFPDRFINVGIAEQNLINISIGLSTMNKIVFSSTYSVFASMRACEQIRTFSCYANNKIIIIATHGGLTPGNDGPTHQAIEDMGIMRTIPNMTIIMPSDAMQTKKILEQAIKWKGPLYIRLTRDDIPIIYNTHDKFKIGKGNIVKDGKDITIIANGDMVYQALIAREKLQKDNISARVIDMHTIKPIDKKLILKSAYETGGILTVEDHNIYNGLGSAVAEILAENIFIPFKRIGISDKFAESGEYLELIKKNKMDSNSIVNNAKKLLREKIRNEGNC